ncbi:MAG: N-acetylglucosamine-6-phosphate deacetylase [Bacillota bacterium]|nr:N-acetylglucosamine-6-phosphate deacetylase [Bacillota bacterium]
MKTFIINGTNVTYKGISSGAVVIEDGKIKDVHYKSAIPEGSIIYDAEGCIVAPGFIDIHVHGGNGYDFLDCTKESFFNIFKTHISHGTTGICPTTVACDTKKLFDFFKLCETMKDTVGFLGIHMEGPFISKLQKGAQSEEFICTPGCSLTEDILSRGKHLIARITAAPEIDGMEEFARRVTDFGIGLSVGHSNAYISDMENAARWGFNQVTHLFCNTPGCRKVGSFVTSGVIEGALLNDDFFVEIIGDGHHIPAETLKLTLKIKGADKVCLVSDSMRSAGQVGVNESYLGEKLPQNRVIIEEGVAKLPDRSSFAGSIALGDMMFKNAVENFGIDINTVSKIMSETPSKLLKIDDRKGSIKEGLDADIVILDKNLKTKSVFINGIQKL